MKLEPIIQSEVTQKEKYQYSILMHIFGTYKQGTSDPTYRAAKETQMQRTDFQTQREKARVGRYERIALKHVYYHM